MSAGVDIRRVGVFVAASLLLFGLYFALTVSVRFAQPEARNDRAIIAAWVGANHVVRHEVIQPYHELLARAAAKVLGWMGEDIRVAGREVRAVDGTFAIAITHGCDAIELTLLVIAAMLAHPSTWRRRLMGMGIAVCALAAANFLRIVTLWFLGTAWPRAFDLGHFTVWPFLLVCGAIVVFHLWSRQGEAGPWRVSEKASEATAPVP